MYMDVEHPGEENTYLYEAGVHARNGTHSVFPSAAAQVRSSSEADSVTDDVQRAADGTAGERPRAGIAQFTDQIMIRAANSSSYSTTNQRRYPLYNTPWELSRIDSIPGTASAGSTR